MREVQCPFCTFARVVAFAAVLPLAVACHAEPKDPPPLASASSTPVTTASAAASVSASPDPSAVASLTPSAVASVQQAASGRDAGIPLGNDAGLGILLGAGTGIGLYGAPPPPRPASTSPINVAVAVSGAKAEADDRIVASAKPRLRYCYERGLAMDPSMKGTLVMTVKLAADGAVTATKKSGSGLSTDVENCMVASTQRVTFPAAPAHAIDVTVTAVNKE